MELESLKEQYKLTKENHNNVLNEIIRETTNNKKTSSQPMLVFVIGQPGAGKTTLMQKMDFSNFVNVNSDKYRKYVDVNGEIALNYHYLK